VAALADRIVLTVYGPGFAPSAPVLALIGIVIALSYQNTLVACCLNAIDRQTRVTWLLATGLLLTIPLDLICIPWTHRQYGNGAIGGAVTFIITEFGILVCLMRALPTGIVGRRTAWTAVRALVASAIMVGVMWPVRETFLLIPICLGTAVYVALVKRLHLLMPEDWRLLRALWDAFTTPRRRARDDDSVGAIGVS
jgi:O-antigen/teichoic acid export membrane protein